MVLKPYHNNTIPLEAQYLYQRGMEMVSLKRTDAALIYFRQAVFIAPGFSRAYRELGDCLVTAWPLRRSVSISHESIPSI